jgi:hypothetical protein
VYDGQSRGAQPLAEQRQHLGLEGGLSTGVGNTLDPHDIANAHGHLVYAYQVAWLLR